jgi:hypothetical protein
VGDVVGVPIELTPGNRWRASPTLIDQTKINEKTVNNRENAEFRCNRAPQCVKNALAGQNICSHHASIGACERPGQLRQRYRHAFLGASVGWGANTGEPNVHSQTRLMRL